MRNVHYDVKEVPSTPSKTERHKFIYVPKLSPFPFSPKKSLLEPIEDPTADEFFDVSFDVPLHNKLDQCHIITEDITIPSSDPIKHMGIEILKKIGNGSFSEVYQVKDAHGNNELALKIVAKRSKYYAQEITFLSALKHTRHCLWLDSAWEHNSKVYILTELCRFGS